MPTNNQTEQAQEFFYAGKLVLLRDLRIRATRKLGYVPIALFGDGSPDLMKDEDGQPPPIPEPYVLLGGTGDSPIERHVAAEHEEIEWADKYLDGLFALFQEGIGPEGVCVSPNPFVRFYIFYICQVFPIFSRMETPISGDHYNPFYEKWCIKLNVLSVKMREFEARTKTVEHGQTQPVATGNKRSGRKRDTTISDRNKEIAALAASGKPPLEIAKLLDARQKYSVPDSWTIKDEGDGYSYKVRNFEKAYYDPQLRKKLNDLFYNAKKSCAEVVGQSG